MRVDFPNGDYSVGDIKNKFWHGKGFYFSKENGIYSGGGNMVWVKATVYVDRDQTTYKGQFKNNQKHGKGKETYKNGE